MKFHHNWIGNSEKMFKIKVNTQTNRGTDRRIDVGMMESAP